MRINAWNGRDDLPCPTTSRMWSGSFCRTTGSNPVLASLTRRVSSRSRVHRTPQGVIGTPRSMVTERVAVNVPCPIEFVPMAISATLHLDSERAENGQVEESKQTRGDERALDDLTDGSTARDSGDEHTHEWGPEIHQPQ